MNSPEEVIRSKQKQIMAILACKLGLYFAILWVFLRMGETSNGINIQSQYSAFLRKELNRRSLGKSHHIQSVEYSSFGNHETSSYDQHAFRRRRSAQSGIPSSREVNILAFIIINAYISNVFQWKVIFGIHIRARDFRWPRIVERRGPRLLSSPTCIHTLQGCTLAVARSQMRPEIRPCDLGFLSGRTPCDQLFGLIYANLCVVTFK